MKILRLLKTLCLLISGFILGCNSSEEQSKTRKQDKFTQSIAQSAGTQAMAKELDELVAFGDPNVYYHWNSKRAKIAQAKLQNSSLGKYGNKFFTYSLENLKAGNSEQTAAEIESLLIDRNITRDNYKPKQKKIYDLLALSYLRDGEQKNCIQNHTAFSCLVPLLKEGQHKDKTGSNKAIEVLKLLVEQHPQDLQNRWLLNLAQMTLGNYPKSLSNSELIELPNINNDFPRFKEIAMSVGVAQNGLSGGVCIDDFNSDGFLDIFCTSYGMEDQAQYFQNDGKGGFINSTLQAGIKGIDGGLNCLHADYDGDGNKDILILRGGWLGAAGIHPNSLLKNKGDGTFEDVTYQAKLTSKHACQTASFLDYDLDGDLDLFFGNENNRQSRTNSELFQNQGDGTFENVSIQAGISFARFVKGVAAGDYNNDGYPDLYISVLGRPNLLFQNQKDGTFKEVSKTAGVSLPLFSFPTWFFDVNNDGWQDLFVGSYDTKRQKIAAHDYAAELLKLPAEEEQPRLYINQKDGTFKEVSKSYEVRKSIYAMGSNYGDIDMDGFLDFYIGTGTPHFGSVVPNRMFRNVNGTKFEEVTYEGGFGHVQKGHGIAFADLNNDGDQEVYAVMGGAFEGDTFTNVLFDKETNTNKWITIDLEGSSKNVDAVGGKVVIITSNGEIHRVVSTGSSFGSNPLRLTIGLGDCDPSVDILVMWPDKNRSKTNLYKIATNKAYKIIQKNNSIETINHRSFKFKTSTDGHHHHHH